MCSSFSPFVLSPFIFIQFSLVEAVQQRSRLTRRMFFNAEKIRDGTSASGIGAGRNIARIERAEVLLR